jgi:polyhydroxybutyrate depolymerase
VFVPLVGAQECLEQAGVVARTDDNDLVLDLGRGPVTVNVPPSYDPTTPAPLVMLLHGYPDTGAGLESALHLTEWSDRLGFLYVYPDGSVNQAGEHYWNGTVCCDPDGADPDDSGYLRALIDAIVAELNVDTERVYVFGLSNGAFMAYRMACEHADIIAAVVSWAGATYVDSADCTPSEPVQILEIHGTADSAVEYEGGDLSDLGGGPFPGAVESVEQWASYNQCSLDPDLSSPPLNVDTGLPGFETSVARYDRGCLPGGSSELWTVDGGPHVGCMSRDFTALVLDFFGFEGVLDGLLSHRSFIAAAAYAAGDQGAFFQTDVEVTNPGDGTESYRFLWLPRDEYNLFPLESETYTIGPRASVRYSNAVHEVFGLEPDAVGAIEVEANSPDLLFMSRTYTLGQGDAGTFGQAMPAISEHDMIPRLERRSLVFASEDDDSRTNIACQTTCRFQFTQVAIDLYDADGSFLTRKVMVLKNVGNFQLDRVFESYRPVNGFARVWTPTAARAFTCYASVLDNVTSDPITILPQVPSDDTIFIPAAALAAGAEGSFFTTDVELDNVGAEELSYELLWLPRGEDNSDPLRSDTYTIAAGTSVRHANVLGDVFGLEADAVGALKVAASGPDLLVMSRTYNLPPTKVAGTFGQEMPGIPANQMTPAGETRRILFLSENDDVRANVGCVNGVGSEVAVAIDLYDSGGAKLETTYMMLPPYSNRQINGIFQGYAPTNGYVEFRTYTPDALIYCYGSVLDNVTSDPTTVPPQ